MKYNFELQYVCILVCNICYFKIIIITPAKEGLEKVIPVLPN